MDQHSSGLINMPGSSIGPTMDDSVAGIAQQLEALKCRTQETREDVRNMEQEQESIALASHECTNLNVHLQNIVTQPQTQQTVDIEKKIRWKIEHQDQHLNHKVMTFLQLRLTLTEKLKDTTCKLHVLQHRILSDELIRWKRDQQLAGNGASFVNNINIIQGWCGTLAELLWLNQQQIKEVERLQRRFAFDPAGVQDILPNLKDQVSQILTSLVKGTFIVEKQPPQVIKTNIRFTSTVRLLVGGKLNVYMTPPQVKVSVISEAQANLLLQSDKIVNKVETSGEILNNTGTMEYHTSTQELSVSFRNMQLKKIKRSEKKSTVSVMEEKFALLFQSQFSVGGGELVFQVWTLSVPVVVVVHGNQEPHAWATITWDNAFAAPCRMLFAVPEKVPWHQVAEALNVKFKADTNRGLTNDNLRFLAEKAFSNTGSNCQDYTNSLLSWAQLCKEHLPGRNFTFWEWFYSIMKLIRDHLREPWNDGYIIGFVQKKQAEEMLSNCPNGTFLMRFSDSELGGITIAWVGEKSSEVFMLQPFTSKDFAIRSLADRLSDLYHLAYLYPDLPKDPTFSRLYTPYTGNPTAGYVTTILRTHVPGVGTTMSTPMDSSVPRNT